ncbi:MAG: S-methyl-5-thioribose-1-phosphate isomerase [Deltaproteobacteria bacterium]|nr:S-methyl-5-thioribose-1-phosphate isomerase [Deltaproteobacteria bacterium]
MSSFTSISWKKDHISILDQTKLPVEETYLQCRNVESVAQAIERLSVRGAPAIGVAAAMGLAWGARKINAGSFELFMQKLQPVHDRLMRTRPTAVNLSWALTRMLRVAHASKTDDIAALKTRLHAEALTICSEDIDINRSMGMHGQEIVPADATIITICNAGALATAGYGTSLGVIRAAVEKGKKVHVVPCETRPLLQGARLTAWELHKDNIPFELITDSMAGYYMHKRGADLAISGADRVAANGDSANKIGTYTLAVLAKENNIPFYIAAPVSTIDPATPTGDAIPIEERSREEITHIRGQRIAPEGIQVWNPAFDVVPNRYIAGIITEKGIIRPPFDENIKKIVG